ncbi:unnamed protein product [Adineta ricciae]|uniref:Endonuclease/exonuclease/phosphatase domain-containing protein n=1 Tax=Adineta ricciae TaxID=249248 RepID=A0A815FUD4_ADIRI|nr:unnamed protein product [Adineta ricciae]
MNGHFPKLHRLGHRPGEQGPRPLSWDQDRVEKLATGTTISLQAITTQRTTSIPTTAHKPISNKLKLAKNVFTIGTWNVRTLYDIVGISEVRWTDKGETANGDFIWSGENSAHMRGVGMLLSTRARKVLIGYNPINSKLITARFMAIPFNITVINVYAPTSEASNDDIETFYDDLEDTILKTPKKDILIITGDSSAKVGDDNAGWEHAMGKHGYGKRNERGEQLLEFATSHNLFICNTAFQQKPNRKWTWESPDGIHKNMIDLILIQKRWKSSVINCRTFQGADISSDHSLVLCNIKLKLKSVPTKLKQNPRLNTQQLSNPTTQHLYQLQLENLLDNVDINCNINEHATQIEQAIKEAVQTNTKIQKEKYVPKLNIIKNLGGSLSQTKQDVIQTWTTYCSKLYRDKHDDNNKIIEELENITSPVNDDLNGILYSEVEEAINKLKKHKSPGNDGITAEMLQAGGECLKRKITFQGADISSDHSLVLCNIKLKLKSVPTKPKQNPRLNTQQLNNPTTQHLYQLQLKNLLDNVDINCNIDEHAAQIEQAIKEAVQTNTKIQKMKN